MPDDDDPLAEALAGSRRVYDQQVSTLESIDDKAMRTVRTTVLILGFAASALTVAGPGALGGLSPYAAAFGVFGVAALIVAAFLGVGIYTVTEYPLELTHGHRDTARTLSREEWIDSALVQLDSAISAVNAEIMRNSEYLELAQGYMLLGSLALLSATGFTVLQRSYGVAPWKAAGGFVVAVVALLVAVRILSPHERWST